ncbi:fibrous sheath-interacting protein 2-like isoform X2 [Rhinatrema bivittatum]|nr:fibrous sheath-interacting protein 2-like isoform X2 [Rhinatrema bivittatum]
MSRNSFLNLGKPDITKIELLKDVQSTQDLIIRLVAHDMMRCDEDEDIDEIVLKEETSLFVKSQYLRDRLPKTKLSSILRSKDLWKSCCKCKCKCSPCCKSKVPPRGPIPTLHKSTSKFILEILPEPDTFTAPVVTSQKEDSPPVIIQRSEDSIPRCVLVPSLHRSEDSPSFIKKEKQIALEETSTASHLTLLYRKLYEEYFDSAMFRKGRTEDAKLKPTFEDISFRQLSLQSSAEYFDNDLTAMEKKEESRMKLAQVAIP